MIGTISAADVALLTPDANCRVSARYSCDVAVSCQPPSVWRGGGREWPARIRDVSAAGLLLVLRRRFEPGTGLAIEVPGAGDDSPSTLLARVLRVRSAADGCWALACTFVSPLGDEELHGLVTPRVADAVTRPEALATQPFMADVAFRGRVSGGGVVRRLIRKLYVPAASSWPLPVGLVIGLRFRPFSEEPPAPVRVDGCRVAGDRSVLECTFLGTAPEDLTRPAAGRRPAAESRS